ncbi:hypothetical protein LTR09_012175 [Extremus antarcticus]|uniref:Uncharacterized protein n=1 Tax=Extremus antarcticus TaxID=702011 RepID=A0AAJ0G707_9PEZI|nr:hypothetical protein LTR09_012175 [Extremus antarcticus]
MPAVAVELFTKCVELAVARNAEFVPPHDSRAFLYIRPVMFAGGSHIALSPARMYTLCVFVTPATAPPPGISLRALIVEQFDRTAPKGCGSKKVGGNYAPVMQYVESAKDQGYSITIHLDSLTGLQVEEFASCAFVAVREGSAEPALVIPDSRNVLHSTTVRAIEALWKEKGWKVERRPIYVSELSSFTEVMAVGTASGIISIASITQDSVPKTVNYDVAAGGPARYAKEWTVDLDAIHHGIVPDRFGWLYQILPISNVDGSS